MIYKIRKHALTTLIYLFSFALLAMETKELDIKLGPLLHIEDTNQKDNAWTVSALYLLPSAKFHPELIFGAETKSTVQGEVLATKFGYDYVKYTMPSHRGDRQEGIKYALKGEKTSYRFFAPAIKQASIGLYHSCDGYQSNADRKKVGGITPMWNEIMRRHEFLPFAFQLGGGDQLYADGLIKNPKEDSSEPRSGKTFGVFALPAVKRWIEDGKEFYMKPFPKEAIAEVDRFYFDHYNRQYSEPGLKEAIASIPQGAEIDDHDLYDGCGSYPEYLQQSEGMRIIRSIASWYAYTIQHHLNADKLKTEGQGSELPAYHFLHALDEGRLAVLSVDTRADRNLYQIVSNDSWDKMYNALEKLGAECKHLLVMLASPVVFASSKTLDKALIIVENEPTLHAVVSLKKDFNNAFGRPELEDDGQDQWCHANHKEELGDMIVKLQEFAQKKNIRVTIISGDVHLGGGGKIYSKKNGPEDISPSAIWQIISSPVGNIPVNKILAKGLGKKAQSEKDLKNDCAMRTFKLRHKGSTKKGPALIARRNFVSFTLLPNNDLYFEWSAERKDNKPHKLYELTVPPL